MRFYLGVANPTWLARTDVPVCITRHRMPKRKLHRSRGPWVLDSGAFTHVEAHGRWLVSPERYVAEVRRLTEAGGLEWAAILDWPCAPEVRAKTRLQALTHVQLTVASFFRLRELAPEVPWLPVIQGWDLNDYILCVGLYENAGFDLRDAPIVGVGSIAGRQDKPEAATIVRALADHGLQLHGFGVKLRGLAAFGDALASADSMSWSLDARRDERLSGCSHVGNCANCLTFALRWRAKVIAQLPRHAPTIMREMVTF